MEVEEKRQLTEYNLKPSTSIKLKMGQNTQQDYTSLLRIAVQGVRVTFVQ